MLVTEDTRAAGIGPMLKAELSGEMAVTEESYVQDALVVRATAE